MKFPPRKLLASMLLVLLGLAGVVWLLKTKTPQAHSGWRVLWSAPRDERVVYLRTGPLPGHILVLSTQSNGWSLRDLDARGIVHWLISGRERLVSPIPMTPVSPQGDRLLLGIRAASIDGGTRLALLECDLRRRKVSALPADLEMTTFPLRQPYSPDGQRLALLGPKRQGQPSGRGVWIFDRRTRKARLAKSIEGLEDLSWASSGNLFVFVRRSGILLSGRPPKLQETSRIRQGMLGSVAPDGSHILVASGYSQFRLYSAYLPNGKLDAVYSSPVPVVTLEDIEWSRYGRRAALAPLGPGTRPVVVGPGRKAKQVDVPETWWEAAGVAFVNQHTVAVVDRPGGNNPDRILAVSAE